MKLIMIIGGMAQGKHAFAAQFTHARCIDGLAAQIRDAVRAGRGACRVPHRRRSRRGVSRGRRHRAED